MAWHGNRSLAAMLVITQFCYIAADRTNQPVKQICFPGQTDIQSCLLQGWPAHAPFEEYKSAPFKGAWIGGLNHTFKVEEKPD